MSTGFNRDRDEFARGGRALIVLPDQGDAHRDAERGWKRLPVSPPRSASSSPTRWRCASRQPKPATLIGSGQVEQLAVQVRQDEADLVVFDASLTPVQQRNLETALEAKVIDRTGLILEIFGERAATAEGRLQVELAHLDYQPAGWCGAGPTSSGSAAASASSAVPAKRRSRPTAG